MFEPRSTPIISRPAFIRRMLVSGALAAAIVGMALGIGVLGYHALAGFAWIDALLNASMILSGMGPVGELPNDAAKLFASAYALFSGVVFITTVGILGAPALHRLLHRFHLEDEESD